ncbi:MAG: cytochrome c oxidase subunit 3 family protein [Myxococcales bacterium]|nr:cytochrome c oxidase subunit 3 family protein [Myxococcales bacterium]
MATDTQTAGEHGPAYLAHHFDTPAQQFDTAKLAMWVFLAQEMLFFSGLFVAYVVFRFWYPTAFSVGSHLLDWKMGMLNTLILLTSSFTAAQAVSYAQRGMPKRVGWMLILTILLAAGFMVVKYFEWNHKFHVGFLPGAHFKPDAEGMVAIGDAVKLAFHGGGIGYHLRTFFGLYFVMTGLHGLHVLIGMGILAWIWVRNHRGEFSSEYWTPIEITALYWHLVDLVWIFLFPFLYLID